MPQPYLISSEALITKRETKRELERERDRKRDRYRKRVSGGGGERELIKKGAILIP